MLRVDTIPWYLKAPFLAFGHGTFALTDASVRSIRATCTIRTEGNLPDPSKPYVYCLWHENLVPLFVAFDRLKDQVWMNHPAWYMKPIHLLLLRNGVSHLCLGSTGNGGREALAQVIGHLKQGRSTSIACDGPAGPYHDLKPGGWLMSRDANIPVIPLGFSCSRSIRLRGWDRKVIPLPSSTITVRYGTPILASDDDMLAQKAEIAKQLSWGLRGSPD